MLTKNVKKLVPAVDFGHNVGGLFDQEQKNICHAHRVFTTKYRAIFTNTKIRYTTGKEARTWLGGPNMRYWPQKSNFAL